MECIGCKAFFESKDIKSGESRECFICHRTNTKKDYFSEVLEGAVEQRKKRGEEFMDMFNHKMNGGK